MIIPRTVWVASFPNGANAKNSLLRIAMRRGLQYGPAIYAQEIAEFNYRAIRAYPASIAIALATGALAYYLGAILMNAAIIGWVAFWVALNVIDRAVTGKRAFEYWGQCVEWRAAVRMGADSQSYLLSQAHSLLLYKVHKDDPVEEIVNGLADNAHKADRWLDKHWDKIQRAYAKGVSR